MIYIYTRHRTSQKQKGPSPTKEVIRWDHEPVIIWVSSSDVQSDITKHVAIRIIELINKVRV
jgi:hypothetical protein